MTDEINANPMEAEIANKAEAQPAPLLPAPVSALPAPFSPITPRMAAAATVLLAVLGGTTAAFEYASKREPADTQAAAAANAPDSFTGVELIAKAAIVIDIRTGETLYAKNADAQIPLASLSKVPLALVVSEALTDDEIITIPYDTSFNGSAEQLKRGDRWRVKDILDYTLIASSNDGADILAAAANNKIHARYPQSPEESATLWRMNDLAFSLGLSRTYFLNVSGLDIDSTQSGAYGSADDMARLFAYAASAAPSLFSVTTESGALLSPESGDSASAVNTNESRGAISGLIMGKTGYTDLAGGNLAVVFDVGLAHPVVAVVLGSTREGRFTDMQKLVTATRAAIASR